ncbi:copper homeostasis protein CutC [Christiangramia sabulilitoris]|uniref:PF03932 family protein CutC n=1 Tax=Christiangramia sabulilitoris TaxID=2583991 RepID=A0A550HZX8_9FLAO|nr:copper homeostasis protein CutC [Christiangramia sabulilitoris]TRO64287.1 copper homeostasis protein CutC [Christiangramia sabulilitoris]
MLIEICANSLESAMIAEKAGADRIELCSELGLGGVTPSFGLVKNVLDKLSIPVHVLVRPRSGNFTYSEKEFEVMLTDIRNFKEMGVAGIVAGVLNDQREIDVDRTAKLLEVSAGLHFTFHRAFDWLKDPYSSLKILQQVGVDTVLTSGGKNNVDEGFELLKELNEILGNCVIMPGSGVNLQNIEEIKKCGFKAVHFSGSKIIKNSVYETPVSMISGRFIGEQTRTICDAELIKRMISKVV